MQTKGYVKIHRKIQNWGWFYDGTMLKAMLWLIINANMQDSEYRGIPVRRGSLIVSRKELSEHLSGKMKHEKVSEQAVRTILKRLERTGEIIVTPTNSFTIVTICKYDIYQGYNNLFEIESTNEQPTVNQQPTIEQPHNKNIRTLEYNNKHSHTREESLITDEEYANIKRRYNEEFAEVFHPCHRLTLNAKIAIRQCVETFGRGSLDKVFGQLDKLPWLNGDAPSGWVPDILWVFTLKNYQRILEGYYTPKKKPTTQSTVNETTVDYKIHIPTKQEREEAEKRRYEETRNRWLGNIRLAEKDPSSSVYKTVINAYHAGTLRQYGIEWQPKEQTIPQVNASQPQQIQDITQQDISYIQNLLNR